MEPNPDPPAAQPVIEGGMTRADIGPLATMASFDLRNGSVESAISMICKPAIPAAFKWVPIDGLPADQSIKYTDVFIKCALMQLEINGLTIKDAPTTKKVGIILGTARAVITEMYRIEVADLIAGEVAQPMVRYARTMNAAGEPVVTWTANNELTAARRTAVMGGLDLSREDRFAMTDIVLCAVGIPPVQGASLMATGHHYLSDAKEKSRPFYKVIEGAHWRKEPTKTWFSTNKEDLQDAIWHKAGHPISIPLKMKLAVNGEIAKKLVAASAGAAASRLPAEESGLKAGKTVRTLTINVRQFFEHFGGFLDTTLLENSISTVERYIPGVKFDADRVEDVFMDGYTSATPRFPKIPLWVVDRSTALTFLARVVEDNKDNTATAFGFFEAYAEATLMTGGNAIEVTLSGAHSLSKLRTDCFAAYGRGKDAYGDYRAVKAAERAAGKFDPPKLVWVGGVVEPREAV